MTSTQQSLHEPVPRWIDATGRPDRRIGRTVLQVRIADSTNAMLLDFGRDGAAASRTGNTAA